MTRRKSTAILARTTPKWTISPHENPNSTKNDSSRRLTPPEGMATSVQRPDFSCRTRSNWLTSQGRRLTSTGCTRQKSVHLYSPSASTKMFPLYVFPTLLHVIPPTWFTPSSKTFPEESLLGRGDGPQSFCSLCFAPLLPFRE